MTKTILKEFEEKIAIYQDSIWKNRSVDDLPEVTRLILETRNKIKGLDIPEEEKKQAINDFESIVKFFLESMRHYITELRREQTGRHNDLFFVVLKMAGLIAFFIAMLVIILK